MITCYYDDKTKVKLRHITVNALLVKGNKVLLAKRSPKAFREPNKWTVPGGYLDHHETMAQGLIREIKEETGYKIIPKEIFVINDNPKRKGDKVKQNVTFIYLVKVIKKTGHHDHEISAIKWFNLNHLPSAKEIAFDHAKDLRLLKQHLKKPFQLPIFTQQPKG